jgi:predicted  nucleic acid-binding Zn-ribbon protein
MKEEFLGLSVLEEMTVACGDCGSKLAHVVVSETNESRQVRQLKSLNSKYQIKGCYKCGGSSFLTKTFSGSTSVCPAKDSFDLDVVDTDIEDDGVVKSILEVRKRN